MFDIRGIKEDNVTLYRMFFNNIRITYSDIKKAPKNGAFRKQTLY
jgi:hypothetical protein